MKQLNSAILQNLVTSDEINTNDTSKFNVVINGTKRIISSANINCRSIKVGINRITNGYISINLRDSFTVPNDDQIVVEVSKTILPSLNSNNVYGTANVKYESSSFDSVVLGASVSLNVGEYIQFFTGEYTGCGSVLVSTNTTQQATVIGIYFSITH